MLLSCTIRCAMKTARVKYAVLPVCMLASALTHTSAQTLQVTPNPAMVDEAIAVRISGLEPGEHVIVRAELVDGAEQHWHSEAQFVADAQGDIDSSSQAPVDGSYKDISGPGLIWSMRSTDKHAAIYQPPRELAAQPVEFQLFRKGKLTSSVTLQQVCLAPGVQRINLQGELHGALFVPAGGGSHPGVLVVGGSEGGIAVGKAVWLAGHGYAALALAYFRYEDLPKYLEAIPLEYFGTALGWMMKRPEIEPEHIAVLGTSRGGELALQLGSLYPQFKAVVAYVPANVRYAACCGATDVPFAWTWHGQPLAYMRAPYWNSAGFGEESALMNAAISVENTKGPILMIGGEDDGVWESSRMVEEAAGRLKRAHFPYAVEVLKYAHAGHRAGLPEIIPSWHGSVSHPVSGRAMNYGGDAKGDAESSLDAIPKVLEFLRTSLEGASAASSKVAPLPDK